MVFEMSFLRRLVHQFSRSNDVTAESKRRFRFEFEPDHPLLEPPDQKSASQILNALDDDCLRELFKYLGPLDLSNVFDVCVRFSYLASERFFCKYTHLVLNHDSEFFDRPKDVERLQHSFGSLIASLDIRTDVRITDGFQGKLTKLRPLLSKLKVLKLKGVGTSDDLNSVLSVCAELKVMCLDTFDLNKWIGRSIKRRFKNLEEARFISINGIADHELHSFIKSNPQLKKLAVLRNHHLDPTKAIRSITRNLPMLEHLELDQSYCNMIDMEKRVLTLGRLKCLKVLKINLLTLSMPMAPLMKALVVNGAPIEHLKLRKGWMDSEAIESISQMKQIRILDFSCVYDLNDGRWIKLVKELPHLREIHFLNMSEPSTIGLKEMLPYANQLTLLKLTITNNISIDEDVYKILLGTVMNRPQQNKLSIGMVSYKKKVNVPHALLTANRKYLHICERIQVATLPSSGI